MRPQLPWIIIDNRVIYPHLTASEIAAMRGAGWLRWRTTLHLPRQLHVLQGQVFAESYLFSSKSNLFNAAGSGSPFAENLPMEVALIRQLGRCSAKIALEVLQEGGTRARNRPRYTLSSPAPRRSGFTQQRHPATLLSCCSRVSAYSITRRNWFCVETFRTRGVAVT